MSKPKKSSSIIWNYHWANIRISFNLSMERSAILLWEFTQMQ